MAFLSPHGWTRLKAELCPTGCHSASHAQAPKTGPGLRELSHPQDQMRSQVSMQQVHPRQKSPVVHIRPRGSFCYRKGPAIASKSNPSQTSPDSTVSGRPRSPDCRTKQPDTNNRSRAFTGRCREIRIQCSVTRRRGHHFSPAERRHRLTAPAFACRRIECASQRNLCQGKAFWRISLDKLSRSSPKHVTFRQACAQPVPPGSRADGQVQAICSSGKEVSFHL